MADEYTNDIKDNPDYQLVMTFLQNIRPGDMDEESSQQLMAIGQRIQGGGTLTDREREMFEAVVGATDSFPTEQMDSFPQGTNPDIMKQPDMSVKSSKMNQDGSTDMVMSDGSLKRVPAQGMAPAQGMGAMSDREMDRSYQVDGGIEQMTPAEFAAAVQSGQITPDELMMESSGSTMTPAERQMMEEEAYFKRLMEEQQALPRMAPEPATPQMRPRPRPTAPMQSPRPQMRR